MFYSNHTYVSTTDTVTVAVGVGRINPGFKADQIWRTNSSAVEYLHVFRRPLLMSDSIFIWQRLVMQKVGFDDVTTRRGGLGHAYHVDRSS